jgi:micrococcal nuclease
MNTRLCALLLFAIFVLLCWADARYDEVGGSVTHVVDGDTFDLQVEHGDSRVAPDEIIRIRLADVDAPETRGPNACQAGRDATAYARPWLLNNKVFLDLDNKTGKDEFGRWVAIVYLTNSDGSLNLSRNFNRMLVDSGHAIIKDFKNNEFDPANWWKGK